jgi:lipopolysaccharide transport system permease protein
MSIIEKINPSRKNLKRLARQAELREAQADHKIIIRPPKGWTPINFRDLWIYRELVYFMTLRNLQVRYKQSVLGIGWAILRPFLTMVVFSIFFGGFAKIPTDNSIPYPIFTFAGILPFELFSKAISDTSNSLVANSHMITKVYFPRIILPLSSVFSTLVDFAIGFVVLLGMMLFYHITPSIQALWAIPVYLLLAVVSAMGIGLWLSAMNVLYRDINYITPFINQLWMYVTPIAYSSTLVSAKWQVLYSLNPMKAVVDGFRWCLLGGPQPGATAWISVSVAVALLISGVFYFSRMERTFADMV